MNLAEETSRCLRCGMCQTVCPLYQVEKREQFVSRGKVQLAKRIAAGTSETSEAAKSIFYDCLDCRACMEVCPSQTNTSGIVKFMRARIFEEHGDSLLMNAALEHLTPYPGRLEAVRKSLHIYQSLGLPGLVRLHPSLGQKERLLPPVPKLPFRQIAGRRPAAPAKTGKVAYFISCTTDILYPQVGSAVMDVLEACGFQVVPLFEGVCCGVPQLAYGHVERAREMALQNMRALPDDVDYVINDCATCGSALREYAELFADTEYAGLAEKYSRKVMDVAEFLVRHAALPAGNKLKLNVTYHEPCHLNRAQSVKDEPRKIIAAAGASLTEMKDAGRCCGGAGTFGITHFELSQKLLKEKVANIAATGSEAVVTGCPGCRMQITYGLKAYYKAIPVYHPVELLAKSLSGK